jgi:hypothetical protein
MIVALWQKQGFLFSSYKLASSKHKVKVYCCMHHDYVHYRKAELKKKKKDFFFLQISWLMSK